MIQTVSIRNFQCFPELDVELKPLTVAIGKNNTGKSTFLNAVALAICATVQSEQPSWTFRHQGKLSLVSCIPVTIRSKWRIHLPGSGPSMTSAGVGSDTNAPPLDAGVATVVDWMLRRDRKRFDAFVSAVRERVPGVVDIQISTPNATTRQLDLEIEGGFVVTGDQASAGVRMLLYFLALAWHPHPPDLVLIEEPETGLHPGRLRDVMDLIRGLTEGRHAPKPVQVILTTHSPYLLDSVDPKTDQVLVFERNQDGSCTAKPLAMDRIGPFLHEFGLGEIWTNEGEAGLVGPS